MPAVLLLALAAFRPDGAAAADGPPSAGAYILSGGHSGRRTGPRFPRAGHLRDSGLPRGPRALGAQAALAFWSMYCQACVQKFNAMIAVQKQYGERGVAVISVNTDGEYKRGEQEIRDFIAEYERQHGIKVNFPVLYDERNWLPQTMNIEFLPTIVTVDPQARVAEFYQKFDEADDERNPPGISGAARRACWRRTRRRRGPARRQPSSLHPASMSAHASPPRAPPP